MEEFRLALAVMGSNMDKLPVQREKQLFAEDLVNYVNDFYAVNYRLDRAERFREITYNAFTRTVKLGINYIQEEYELPTFLREIRTWDENTFFYFAGKMKKKRLRHGLEPLQFLYFCVDVTQMAIEFFRNGLCNVPELAVIVIYVTLGQHNMFSGGWNSLNIAAREFKEKIDVTENFMIDTTPSTSSGDSSGSESRQRMSQSSSSDKTSDDGTLLNSDNDGNISSDEGRDEIKSHGTDPESTSAIQTERCGRNLQLPNAPTENQHMEPIHDFLNSLRAKGEAVTQQEDVKEDVGYENLRQPCAIANGIPLQHAHEYQRVVEDNGRSTSGGAHGTNMYDIPGTSNGVDIYSEFFPYASASYAEEDIDNNP